MCFRYIFLYNDFVSSASNGVISILPVISEGRVSPINSTKNEGKMFPEEREIQILNYLKENGRIEVKNLSRVLSVSEVTIRSDLSRMEEKGLLARTHGGAIPCGEKEQELSFNHQIHIQLEQKKKIARAAVELIKDHAKIILGTGTTIQQMGDYLEKKKNLTIITPSLPLSYKVSLMKNISLLVTGGYYRSESGVLFGPLFKENMQRLFVEMAFIGAKGINENYATDTDMIEAEVNNFLLSRAEVKILLADSSKIGNSSFAAILPTSQLNILITDEGASPDVLEKISRQGVQVIIAN